MGPATRFAATPAASTRADRLRLARRLDWRFLLPDPALGDVAFFGRDDGILLGALRTQARSVTVIDATTAGEPRFDLVVAHDAPQAAVPRVLDLLRPGGHLYWEIERQHAPLATPGSIERRLRRAGFESVDSHWHRPGFRTTADIVPLMSPQLVAAVLDRGSTRAAKRALAGAARALQRARLLDYALPCWSALGRKPGAEPRRATNSVAAFLAAHHAPVTGFDPHALHYRWRLPHFAASSHVVCLASAGNDARPVLVVKVPRLPSDEAAVEREAAALLAAQASRPGGFDSIPRCVAFARWRDRGWLAQTAFAGQALDAAYVRRHAPETVDAVTRWLAELHRATRGEALGTAGIASLVLSPATAALRHVRGDGLASELAATRARLGSELASCSTVFEHGDLGAPNLLIEPRTQRLGVIDWECADARGLPAGDLVFFLAFVASARAGARTPAEHVAAYDRAFLAPRAGADAWAHTWLVAHARTLDIPTAALPQIVVATWMRATRRAVERLAAAPGEIESTAPGIARVLALWRRTLERFDALEF